MATIAPVNTIRGVGSAAISSVQPARARSAREKSSVSATFGASRTLLEIVRSRSASAGALASTRSARAAKRVLGGAEARGVDPLLGGDVIDAVVDDQRGVERVDQHLRLRHVRPQDRPPQAEPAGGAPHEQRGSRRLLSARASRRAMQRQRRAARARAARRRARGGARPRRSRRAMRARSRPASCGRRRPSDSTNSTRFSRARRDIRWCWLVHSSVSQSANPTHTMSRPRRVGESGIGAMIPGVGACSLASVPSGGQTAGALALLEELRERFPRVAVVHDWLTIPGGSEQVVLELLEMFPQAELFTSVYDPSPWPAADHRAHRPQLVPEPHPGRRAPLPEAAAADEHGVPLVRPGRLRPRALEQPRVRQERAHAAAARCTSATATRRCDTPGRRASSRARKSGASCGWLLPPLLAWLRRRGPRGRRRPDVFVANSRHVAERIERYYGRSAEIVHPPVDVEHFLAPGARSRATTTWCSAGSSRTSASTSRSRRARVWAER